MPFLQHLTMLNDPVGIRHANMTRDNVTYVVCANAAAAAAINSWLSSKTIDLYVLTWRMNYFG